MFERRLTLEVLDKDHKDNGKDKDKDPIEVELVISQESSGSESVVVWDAALVLAYYLERHQDDLFHNKKANKAEKTKVVELGSGTGVVGIAAAALG